MDVILKFIYLAFCAQLLIKDMMLGNGLCETVHSPTDAHLLKL